MQRLRHRQRPKTRVGVSLYDALGVAKDASGSEIRQAYRRQMHLFHPRKHMHDPGKAENYYRARRAYSVLGHPERRKIYDKYGSFGLEIAETIGERFVVPAYVLSKWWGRLLLTLIILLSCCCFGCCCCCGCCCGCCGIHCSAWDDHLEHEHDDEVREQRQGSQLDDHESSEEEEGQQKGVKHVQYEQTTVQD